MRFRAQIRNIQTFAKLMGSLSPMGPVCWLQLNDDEVRFTILPEQGTQVWASLPHQTLFIDYLVNSANENVINLEFNPAELHRALRSCASADEVVIRLTKRSSDHIPCLCLTINHGTSSVGLNTSNTLITQEVPIRILSLVTVAELHEPACPSPDVFLILPPLFQIRAMTDRFNRLATVSRTGAKAGVNEEPKLFLSASRDGTFSMKLEGSDMVEVETRWMGLEIPALNPLESSSRSESRRSTRRGRDQLAGVRVGGREWGKVLKVAAVAKKVTACFCEGHALVLFVHLTGEDEEYTANISYYMSHQNS